MLAWAIFPATVHADDLQRAKALEQQGHRVEAITAYRKWISKNPHGSKWDSALLDMVDLMDDPKEAVATLADSLSQLSSDSARHTAYVKIGQLDELLGYWSAAQESFQNASLVPGVKDFRSLLESARILTQLGELGKASGQVRSIIGICPDQTIVAEARVLSAKLDAITGSTQKATAEIQKMLGSGVVSMLSAESLTELYETCGRLNLKEDQSVVADLLAQNYPRSPEESLITGKTEPVPSPAVLLGYRQGPYDGSVHQAGTANPAVDAASPKSTASPGSAGSSAPSDSSASAQATAASSTATSGSLSASSATQSSTIDIQIGSYRDATNAKYRLQDLEAAGFSGKVLKASVNGKTYYKVVVPGVPSDRSQEYLTRLKEKGFEGFLLYDQ